MKYMKIRSYSRSYPIKILSFLIVLILLLGTVVPVTALPFFFIQNTSGRAIVWDVTLNFQETGGKTDSCMFGEAPDANDGPPPDSYDMPKPPTPPPSYIRAWFTDNLPIPYNLLLKDYRHYPDTAKTWDLYTIWVPADLVSPTTITISWSPTLVNTSEYDSVVLYDVDNTVQVADMKYDSSFVYFTQSLTTRHFKILATSNTPPNTPSSPTPANHATAVDIDADLSWTGGDPDPGDTVTYDVYFGDTNPPPLIANNHTSTSYSLGSLNFDTTYYWRIVAWDNHGADTIGPMWDFTTEINNPPNPPSNPSPSNGATNVNINADLSWTGGDPDGDQVFYDVYFGAINPPPHIAFNISNTLYDPGTLNFGTTYYWRIIAWDEHDASTTGTLWSFQTVQNSPPYIPSNPNPPNHAVNVDVDADLSWTGGDPDPGDTVYYDVYLGTTTNPPLVSENQLGTTYNPGTMQANKKYYWRIISEDTYGQVANGPLWDFTTENNPPNIPNTPYPPNGAINVAINPILSWVGGDPDGDQVFYDVYFGTSSPPPKQISNQTTLTYFPGNLDYLTMYYWKIVAWDSQGACTEGPLWQFTTRSETVPPSVRITRPREAAVYLADVLLWFFFPTTLIIGKITINVEAADDESGMHRVEFYIDDEPNPRFTDYQEPYSWVWDEMVRLFPRKITAKAYDNAGNNAADFIEVWKWL